MVSVNTKVDKLNTTLGISYSRFIIVDSRLGEFVKRIRSEKGMSVDDVQNNSRKGGKKGISAAYVNKIENNSSVHPTTPKLMALADGLGVTQEEIFALVRGAVPNKETLYDEKFEELSLKFGGLSATKKEKAAALIELLDRELDRLAKEA